MWLHDLSCICMPSDVHGLLLAPCSPHTADALCINNFLDTLTVLPPVVSRCPSPECSGVPTPSPHCCRSCQVVVFLCRPPSRT